MRISDWSSDVCSSDLQRGDLRRGGDRGGDRCDRPSTRRHPPCAPRAPERQAHGDGERRGRRARRSAARGRGDRKSVVQGKSVSVRVELGGRRIIKKKMKTKYNT